MLKFVGICAWEGFAAAVIALGTAVAAMETWPKDTWQFVILTFGGLGAFAKGVDAYRRTPH